MKDQRVLSGMRPTGPMHLGHYHGCLKNWVELQNEYDSYYFVADWHAFTTHYSDNIDLESNCLLYTSPSPRDPKTSRMPSSA